MNWKAVSSLDHPEDDDIESPRDNLPKPSEDFEALRHTWRTLAMWNRFPGIRKFDWQNRRAYWILRSRWNRLTFWISSRAFNARSKVKSAKRSLNVAQLLLRLVASGSFYAFIAVWTLHFLEQLIVDWNGPHFYTLTRPTFDYLVSLKLDSSAYTTLAGTIAQVAGVFLGLYFAAISSVASSVYSRVSADVRAVVVEERVGNVYVRLVATLGAVALIDLAMLASGLSPGKLNLAFLLIMSVLSIFAFVVLGVRTFNFFDPTGIASHLLQRIPPDLVCSRNLPKEIELPADRLFIFLPPVGFAGTALPDMIDSLCLLNALPRVDFLTDTTMSALGYSFKEHLYSRERALLEVTRDAGSLDRLLDDIPRTEYFIMYRFLKFQKFVSLLRQEIFQSINEGLKKLNRIFGCDLTIKFENLVSVPDVDEAIESLKKGKLVFDDAIKKFM